MGTDNHCDGKSVALCWDFDNPHTDIMEAKHGDSACVEQRAHCSTARASGESIAKRFNTSRVIHVKSKQTS